MKRLFALPMPDWTDREAVANFAAARAEIRGDNPVAARDRRAEIPGARLLVLGDAATAIPDAVAGEVAEAMLALG